MAAFPLGHGDLVALLGERRAVGGQVHGLAVREDFLELGAGHARPGAHRAGVQMHEGAAGGRIVADAAHLLLHGGGPQLGQGNAGNEEVHGIAAHMLGIVGDAGRLGGQHGIGCGRTIGRDNVDGLGGAHFLVDLPNQVEQARVHLGGLIAPPVAQELVELVEARLDILPIALEDDARGFPGMGVIEVERALSRGLDRRGRQQSRNADDRSGKKPRGTPPIDKPHNRHAKLCPVHSSDMVDVSAQFARIS